MGYVKLLSIYDKSLQEELEDCIKSWHMEVKELLPTFPDDIDIQFDNDFIVPGFGTGGAAWSPRLLKLAYDPDFDAPHEELIADLRATYFHEGYHLARGFSFESTPYDLPAIKNAVEEGLATKFEAVHADSDPGYVHYEDRDTMLAWLGEVRGLPDGFDYDWQRWKFFDPETGRKWILYKVGVFIVDEALANNPGLTIEKLVTYSADEVIDLSKL